MAETIEIPELEDANLMELTVCGQLDTKKSRIKEKLKEIKDGIFARVGNKKNGRYIRVFGGGGPANTHLHVDIFIRTPDWASAKKLSPLIDVQAAIMQFAGIPADVIIEGEFVVDTSELPKRGIIRSAMGTAKHGGLTARQTAQSLTFSDSPIRQLRWEELNSDVVRTTASDVNKSILVLVGLVARNFTRIDTEYLLDGESFVVRAFNALILGGKTSATSRR